MALWQILLGASVLLSIDCILEMALVSGLVAYVHGQNSAFYTIEDNGTTFNLQSRAGQFTEDGGHLSNAAGGIGFFLGLWGIYMALRLKKSQTGREVRIHQSSLPNFKPTKTSRRSLNSSPSERST